MLSVLHRQCRRNLALCALAAAIIAAGLLSGPSRVAASPGVLDEALTGNPDCNSTNFRGVSSSYNPLEQEFVPSASNLEGVELCLGISSGTQVTLNIREGTAGTPGTILATGTASAPANGVQWVLVHLPSPLSTTPGTKLVLEIPDSSTFQWRGTCPVVSGSCTSVDPDLYPAGGTNNQFIGDFVFRTYAPEPTPTPTSSPIAVHHRRTATPTPEPTHTPAPSTATSAPPTSVAPAPTATPFGRPAGVVVAPPSTGDGASGSSFVLLRIVWLAVGAAGVAAVGGFALRTRASRR